MALRCLYCHHELARLHELAFYLDKLKGYSLGFNSEIAVPDHADRFEKLPDTSMEFSTHKLLCVECKGQIGRIHSLNGFYKPASYFSPNCTLLPHAGNSHQPMAKVWKRIASMYPDIKRFTSNTIRHVVVQGDPLICFEQNQVDMMFEVGHPLGQIPLEYQLRSFFFACLNDTVLYLHTGMGKTLVACMAIRAFRDRNPAKGAFFLVPRVLLVDQQANYVQEQTGIRPVRRSSHHAKSKWVPTDVVVCTSSIFLSALMEGVISASQVSIIVFDEAHGARGDSSYMRILRFVFDAHKTVRPRLLALTAIPLVGNASFSAVQEMVSTFRADIYSPFLDPAFETSLNSQDVKKKICDITHTADEAACHKFIIQSIDQLAKVHPPIASAWKACLGTQYLDVSFGVIRDLKETAHKEYDTLTYRMARYLEKWMDALEVLRLSGPRKLLANIKEHYECADNDDAVLTQYLHSFRAFLGTTINHLASIITQKESTSLEALLECIRSFVSKCEKQKMIVFVTRRKTAIRLCKRLCSESDLKDKMNPCYILGSQSGFSKDRQPDALCKFREGRCRLIVATSMLEQGLDVDSCGLVVCFDGVRSLTALIQCHGRARNTSSEFVIFTNNVNSIQTLQDEEDKLNNHVSRVMKRQTACSPMGISKEILNKLVVLQQEY